MCNIKTCFYNTDAHTNIDNDWSLSLLQQNSWRCWWHSQRQRKRVCVLEFIYFYEFFDRSLLSTIIKTQYCAVNLLFAIAIDNISVSHLKNPRHGLCIVWLVSTKRKGSITSMPGHGNQTLQITDCYCWHRDQNSRMTKIASHSPIHLKAM